MELFCTFLIIPFFTKHILVAKQVHDKMVLLAPSFVYHSFNVHGITRLNYLSEQSILRKEPIFIG